MVDGRTAFRERFAGEPLVVRSPGRINLIGEHTDYNDGYVLPAAIDRAITLAVGPAAGRRIVLYAADLGEGVEADLDALRPGERRWATYLLGVADQLRRRGLPVDGFACAFGGDVPIGAGLASSAAITTGLAFALNELFSFGLEKASLARIAQAAEHEFAGVRCGIMDQIANLHGRAGHALKLDCRSLVAELVPFTRNDVRIVLCDTGVRHALATSAYNERRRQCEAGVAVLSGHLPDLRALRDVDLGTLESSRAALAPVVYRRCRHVVAENARVLAASDALRRGDIAAFGSLMYESHASLRDDYAVSCPELDALVEIAAGVDGVLGARMMGGGFGGCTINLVLEDAMERFTATVNEDYPRRANARACVFEAPIGDGTSVIQ